MPTLRPLFDSMARPAAAGVHDHEYRVELLIFQHGAVVGISALEARLVAQRQPLPMSQQATSSTSGLTVRFEAVGDNLRHG
jgi:hypothetical protein